MKKLEERILADGRVLPGNILLVDSFLNQGLDIELFEAMAETWYRYFENEPISKVMTIEASGIAIAALVARIFSVPALFAKKYDTLNLTSDRHQSNVYSYTKKKEYSIAISKRLLTEDDHVLIVDDFLANGCALRGLIDLVESAQASIAGIGIAIEKSFQEGPALIRAGGYNLCSLAKIASLENGEITFAPADA
ncbi:MAG: xanthine phosphoribosyltransferase [Clostridiaceae bacterium]|jgi:xanthine phosphoribosyltransferase|nr:xanthine phosphoribosyltransferase [Clostridiaceae bacterium]